MNCQLLNIRYKLMKLCSNYYHCDIFVCRILYVEHVYHVTKLDALYSNIAYTI